MSSESSEHAKIGIFHAMVRVDLLIRDQEVDDDDAKGIYQSPPPDISKVHKVGLWNEIARVCF